MSLKSKLKRLKSHMSHVKEIEDNDQIQPIEHIPHLEEWKDFGAKPVYYEGQYIFVRKRNYSITSKHGHHQFSEIFDVFDKWKQTDYDHPLHPQKSSPEELLFFDTETTGLAGTGTTIFLLGCASVTKHEVIVTQYFLPSPSAEVAFYSHFLSDVQDLQHLVTFNGKSFDWPQVKTRHTLLRDLVPHLPPFGHYDLLHASRRLWKGELDNVRLATVEINKLSVTREKDVPGFLAPMIYFDFLKEPNPIGIKGVISHNELDVLSLITLYIEISQKILHLRDVTVHERYEIAKWMESLGAREGAMNSYDKLKGSTYERKATFQQAMLLKKNKEYEKACQAWESIVQQGAFVDETVAIELAKAYEHKFRNYSKAHYYAELAYNNWLKKRRILSTKTTKEQADYMKRLQRLKKKINES
ncbi:ribonuclease H-like domain-containing protein [Bacillus solimangrovi]|uniref:YprB ribonuclease H-like domain-containing protein n=1 Tax=Bacillus solimangrovi TaxID=1305675 RepID=A0A1E5LFX4_9BACI|nr:ribonuclease H-like domain-containing protein [Bacillus solimangrovi]OEH92988.1 hypothetical protein BFG57_14080 [Bacillus solimangrovi]